MKYLKFMPFYSVKNASRNKRELSAAAEYGYDTYVFSSDLEDKEEYHTVPFKLICSKYEAKPKGVSKPVLALKVLKNIFYYMKTLRELNMDIVSCHNLYSLLVADLAYKFVPKSKRPKLIYDAHEYELRRKKRNKISYNFIKGLEGYLIKKCVFSIMINEGVSEGYKELYNLKDGLVVILSTPDYWELDYEDAVLKRQDMCDKLSVGSDAFIVVYHGVSVRYRGIEELIRAAAIYKDFYIVMITEAFDKNYEKYIEDLIDECHVRNRIIKYPLQPIKDLSSFLVGSDCGIVMNNMDNLNYIFASPNKFFENIQACNPVVCTNSPVMGQIVNKYDIGIASPSGDEKALAENIKKMKEDKTSYNRFKNNLKIAKEELCWEREKERFFEAFKKYL